MLKFGFNIFNVEMLKVFDAEILKSLIAFRIEMLRCADFSTLKC